MILAISMAWTLVHAPVATADTFDGICDKDWRSDEGFDVANANTGSTGLDCCTSWRLATCYTDVLPNIARSLAVEKAREGMRNSGCERFADNVGSSVPLPCYWRYRRWAVILLGVAGLLAVIIPTIVFVAVRRRRRQALQPIRMF